LPRVRPSRETTTVVGATARMIRRATIMAAQAAATERMTVGAGEAVDAAEGGAATANLFRRDSVDQVSLV
jgi:hypothetical protein